MTLKISRQILEKYSNTKFHENPSSEGQVVLSGRTDMPKLIVTFRYIASAPKIAAIQLCWRISGMSVVWRLPTLTGEWFLAGTCRCAKHGLPLPTDIAL
jgi:hypothetical protein